MTAVPEVDDWIDPILAAFRRSHERVVDQMATVVADPKLWRRQRRLREVATAIEREMATLERPARAAQTASVWANELGFATGAVSAGAQTVNFDLINRSVVDRYAKGLYTDLLEATDQTAASARRLLRRIHRDVQLQAAIEGRTAVQAAREMTRLGGQAGVYAVRYANGAHVGLGAYSEMAVRTVSGTLYNEGIVDGAQAEGTQWFECFDGPDCGWVAHDDPTTAAGAIVSASDAAAYPLAHPNCRRTFGPRPDVASAKQAEQTPRSDTEAQRQDQIRADLARGYPVDRIRADAAAQMQVRGRIGGRATPGRR